MMDYTKFLAKVVAHRKGNLIRDINALYEKKPSGIVFAGGMPNVATFPIKDISLTFKPNISLKLDERELSSALQYLPTQGYAPLLKKWKEFQTRWHKPKYNDWDAIVMCGSMDGCNKVFEMMINPNDPIMIQIPTYSGVIGALRPLSPEIVQINQDADGIIPEDIAEQCEQRRRDGKPMPKFLYVNPTAANPTGTVLSDDRRRQVYKLAQIYDFLIVEDDPYCFIHFLDKQPLSFFSLDTDGRVIRLDSFSKIISSGMRLGVVTAGKKIVSILSVHMSNSLLHAPALSQVVLYKLLDVWGWDKFEEHFKDVQRFYRERRDIMLAAIEKHLTGLAEWTVPQGGMFFWLKIQGLENATDLAMQKSAPAGVFVLPESAFNYTNTYSNNCLRLSYSYASPEEMDKGLSILANIIRENVKQNSR
ncbi:hypothetical protein DMN91_009958 [Ooceraea biroi]|uniref:Kynurenine/alpha-aminoadipate aminotransferase, mitochondrial n=1 Tax=Ooceraea biroi TaxID=2015173 RepID=A0A026WK82_OOCBI|nr:kynurenine/alpha-aminoadipate aminotransferase, mitochondrial [Ooceraea biroi]EZA56435.1 Kynurenine/alpha-aminoadipate aminotransferase, mitochondrial [Ooceraea biroi]RLU17721.1 hypothetical protein DMN91_009958 [Ooceraea biroi]